MPSFPWPVQINFCHSWVFSSVWWAFACKALFQWRLLSFVQHLCLSFYSNMALAVSFCTMVWGKRSSWHSSSLPVANGCSPAVGVCVLTSLKLQG